MQKKKALVYIAVAAVILAFFLLGFLQQKREEYIIKKECFKHRESYRGENYNYTLPNGTDCTPYLIELDAAYPGPDH